MKSDSVIMREKEDLEKVWKERQEQKVVVIQSYYRGKEGRKKIQEKQREKLQRNLVQEDGLEYVDEKILEDGSIYSGQMREDQKQGFGI